jgi:uncharacterized protein (TIGR02001 family)
MLNKKLLTAAVTTALMAGFGSTQVLAADDFAISGNIALTSDYRFRGISQSDEDPAVQGGFDASFEPGFYLGTWASSIDFGGGNDTGSFSTVEVDYYGGWRGPVGDTDFGIDAGYAYYQYPGDTVDPKGDYQEFYIKGSWTTLVLGLAYSDDYYAETGEFWYVSGDYSYKFMDDLALGLHLGYNMTEQTEFDSNGNLTDGGFLSCLPDQNGSINGSVTQSGGFSCDTEDYTDYSISLTYSVVGVDLSIAYVGTELDEEDYFGTELAEPVTVFTIKKVL